MFMPILIMVGILVPIWLYVINHIGIEDNSSDSEVEV